MVFLIEAFFGYPIIGSKHVRIVWRTLAVARGFELVGRDALGVYVESRHFRRQ